MKIFNTMTSIKIAAAATGILLAGTACRQNANKTIAGDERVHLITLDPGHFHAALVQKTAYPKVSDTVYVYAPDGDDLHEHLKRIEAYNTRPEAPTNWNEILYTGDDFLAAMLREKKGNVMITAGNNGKKVNYIHQTVKAGIHVLADKPMAINEDDFNTLKECFRLAEENGVFIYDIMTERFEITTILQHFFSCISMLYGDQLEGTPEDPAIVMQSVHHFLKTVSGTPLKRPAWFFDVRQQGEGIVDVTTHLVDLVQTGCFSGETIDCTTDIRLLDANHWTTPLSLAEFTLVTGLDEWPDYLLPDVTDNTLHVYSNGDILYQLRGINVKVSAIWNYAAPEGGGDTHYSIMRGSLANLIIEQGKEQNYQPELYIEAAPDLDLTAYEEIVLAGVNTMAKIYPDITVEKIADNKWHILIPQKYREGHEAHFGRVMENFLEYLDNGRLPAWETPNMIAKYYITTQALKLARSKTHRIKNIFR